MSPAPTNLALARPTSVVARFAAEGVARFRRYWLTDEPPHAAALFRIGLGIYLLIRFLSDLPHVTLYYSSDGIAWPYLEAPNGTPHGLYEWIGLVTQPPPPLVAWLIYVTWIISLVLITVGWLTRIAFASSLALFIYYWFLSLHGEEASYDRLAWLMLFFLALSRCDAVYSMAAWRRKRRGLPAIKRIEYWPIRLLTLQVIFLYVGTGVYKVMTEQWGSGEILFYTFQLDWTADAGYWIVQQNLPMGVYDFVVLMTILMEVCAPFLLLARWWKWLFFVWGFGFHLMISITLSIWPFMVMPLSYILFMEPAAVKRWCRRWERRAARTPLKAPGSAGGPSAR